MKENKIPSKVEKNVWGADSAPSVWGLNPNGSREPCWRNLSNITQNFTWLQFSLGDYV